MELISGRDSWLCSMSRPVKAKVTQPPSSKGSFCQVSESRRGILDMTVNGAGSIALHLIFERERESSPSPGAC